MGRLGGIHKRAQGIVGILTLGCGFFMMWGSARGSIDDSESRQGVRAKAIEIDPLFPSGSNNGALVLAAHRISSLQQLEDEFLKPGPYLILTRRVEMFQWTEHSIPMQEQPEYKLSWTEGQVDFFSFRIPQGHENPLLRVEPMYRRVDTATFGAFDASMMLRSVRVLLPVELSPDKLKDPSLKIEDNKIIVPRATNSAGGAALGDMRVWYEGLLQGDYTILTRQVDERNLIGASPVEGMVMRKGLLSMDQFFKAESVETKRVSDGLLYIGGFIFFIGLSSVLSPLASRCSLRPKFPVDGMPAILLISAGLALTAVSIFFVVSRFGY